MGLGNVFLNDLIELKQKGALDGAMSWKSARSRFPIP
jgi:hypothetical protein